jgi:hypothetical protein
MRWMPDMQDDSQSILSETSLAKVPNLRKVLPIIPKEFHE